MSQYLIMQQPHATQHYFSYLSIFRFLGPGILVAVGFIDPGNWASNIAAGSDFGYHLLWVVTLSTIILIIMQHNAAHLGLVTGRCLAENAAHHLPPWLNIFVLGTSMIAAVSTALAEILGGGIALQMLFGLNLITGVMIVFVLTSLILFYFSYKKIELTIVLFVLAIVVAFIIELFIVPIDWHAAAVGWVKPELPHNSIVVIMAVLGAVVMPHNLFLHSEIIQSRALTKCPTENDLKHHVKCSFVDTLFSMLIGWAINSVIIIIAAAIFFKQHIHVESIQQSSELLSPVLGKFAASVFAIAFLFAGVASSITAGFAGGSIFSGMFKKSYNESRRVTQGGIIITLLCGALAVLFLKDPFKGLIYSQVLLSVQLPITMVLQIYLTSSKKVMGAYANKSLNKIVLTSIAVVVGVLNIILLKASL